MLPYYEIAWARDNTHLTYIDSRIADLVGWSIEEIMAMDDAHDVLMHPDHARTIHALHTGEPNTVAAHTLDLALRHKNGYDVPVQSTVICRYGPDGALAEMYGATHRADVQHAHLSAWWKQTDLAYHQAALDMATLYPVAV